MQNLFFGLAKPPLTPKVFHLPETKKIFLGLSVSDNELLSTQSITILQNRYQNSFLSTALKLSKYEGFFWSVFSSISIEYRKTRTRKSSVFEHFSLSAPFMKCYSVATIHPVFKKLEVLLEMLSRQN